jgi:type I restriction enzyme S subunit
VRRVRLDWVLEPVRDTVPLEEIQSNQVFHYSIPFLDEFGDGAWQDGSEIESAKQRVSGGEILISRLNPRKSRVHVTTHRDGLSVCSGEFVVFRPRLGVSTRFLQYVLSSEAVRLSLDSQVRSVTRSQQRVEVEAITKMWIDLPSVEEQRRTVDFLDAETGRIDELIAEQTAVVDLAAERHSSLVVGLLAPTSQSEPVALKRLASRIQTGATPPTSEARYYEEGTLPWFGPSSFGQTLDMGPPVKMLAFAAASEGVTNVFPAGAVMIVTIGATIGKVAQLTEAGACNQQITAVVVRPEFDSRFVAWAVAALGRRIAGTAPNTTLPIFTQSALGRERIWVPSPSEQRRIAEVLDASESKLVLLRSEVDRQVAMLNEHRQALITAAVTGGLDAVRKVA